MTVATMRTNALFCLKEQLKTVDHAIDCTLFSEYPFPREKYEKLMAIADKLKEKIRAIEGE